MGLNLPHGAERQFFEGNFIVTLGGIITHAVEIMVF